MKKRRVLSLLVLTLIVLTFAGVQCKRKDDLQKGVEALEKGDYEKALRSLSASLSQDSLDPDIHFNMSLAYAHLGSKEQACRHFYKAYSLDSTSTNDIRLKEMLARSLDLDPYVLHRVSMKNMNQFKGVFSPDNKAIVTAAAKRDIANIYVININGKIITQLTKRGMNTDPDYSPTGEYIVFASDADGDDDIYMFNVNTKELTNLTSNSAKDFFPSFSPDGKEIVFISNMDNEYKWEIYRMDLKNKNTKRLTNNTYWDGFPKFTPDGKKIIFSSKRNGSEDIYIMNRNGGGEKVLYATEADENDPQMLNEFLFFKSNQSGEWIIYRYNTDSEEIIALTDDKYPSWNPRLSTNGSRLVLARKIKNQWRLYFLDLESGIPASQIAQKIEKIYDVLPKPEENIEE